MKIEMHNEKIGKKPERINNSAVPVTQEDNEVSTQQEEVMTN